MNLLAHTYSIVARCAKGSELGCAVASAVPAVGAICVFMRSGLGVVCTQSWVNPYLAESILNELAADSDAPASLSKALRSDGARDYRQVGVVDAQGQSAAWTGEACTSWCGNRSAADFSVQGNMLTGPAVLDAMADAFCTAQDEALDKRLLAALEAAQSAGGDKRGRQSAALRVIGSELYPRVDLRVDDHPDPVAELRRIHGIAALQLAPFVAGMPRRDGEPEPPPDAVVNMLLNAPPDRPGGGGSRSP